MSELPSDWRWVKCGDVLKNIEAGKSFKAEQRPALPNEKGVLKISALTWGKFQSQENKALPLDTDINGIPTVRAGDLLISRANTVELVGAVAVADKDYPHLVLSDKTLRLNPDLDTAHPRYLLYVLRTPEARHHIESHATGTSGSMRNITQVNIRKTPIPLPPIAEQRRIAAILDKADAIRRKRKQALQYTEELLRATFLDMFGDPVTNPKGWKVFDLGSVTESKLGKMLSKAAKQGVNPIPYLGNSHVRWRSFELEDLPTMDFTESELRKLDLRNGDLLVCEGGEVGRCAIWRDELQRISFQKAIHRIRCDESQVLPEYLQEYFYMMALSG